MTKATRQMSGASLAKYLREMLLAEPGLPPATAESLLLKWQLEIAQVRIRLPLPVRTPATKPDGTSPAITFDPYAFSAVVVLTKGGRQALLDKLSEIQSADHLKALALAQHIAVSKDAATAEALRTAIVDGTVRRIADRKAAAS